MPEGAGYWLALAILAIVAAGLGLRTYLQSEKCHADGGIPVRPPFSMDIHCVRQID